MALCFINIEGHKLTSKHTTTVSHENGKNGALNIFPFICYSNNRTFAGCILCRNLKVLFICSAVFILWVQRAALTVQLLHFAY